MNKDGHLDLLSGCWPGEICIFWGTGPGTFGGHEALKFTDDKAIKDESASSVAVTDWNNDGHLDLIVGYIMGPVRYYENDGKTRFKQGVPLKAGGKDIQSHDGGPCIADWDGDGINDLILGDDSGTVLFFKAQSGSPTPTLAAGQPILSANTAESWKPRTWNKTKTMVIPSVPGARTKPAVCDWNNDGKLDLLVGDFSLIKAPEKKLTAEQTAQMKKVEAQQKTVSAKFEKIYERLIKETDKAVGFAQTSTTSKDDIKKWQDKFIEVMGKDKEYQDISKQMTSLNTEMQKYVTPDEPCGFVWVYLRK